MSELMYDRILGIKTTGLREWRDKKMPYNRYEPTPYRALEKLFKYYKLQGSDELVDFGCGRGRVAFYIHNRFRVPVVGIEVNEQTYEEALENKARYRLKANHIRAPIRLEFGLAEQYKIKPAENKFYFFNPFTVKIFQQVVDNILDSVSNIERSVDLILYYPRAKYKKYLKRKTPFKLHNKIVVPEAKERSEKFLIYRYPASS